MRLSVNLLVAVILAHVLPTPANANNVTKELANDIYGMYTCVANHVIGIQDENPGKFNMSDTKRFFIIKIQSIRKSDKDPSEIPYCKGYSKALSRGEDIGLPRLDYWFHCLSGSRLIFSPGKSVRELRADIPLTAVPNTFHDSLRGWFTLFPNGQYKYVWENFDSHDTYLESGECLPQPKIIPPTVNR